LCLAIGVIKASYEQLDKAPCATDATAADRRVRIAATKPKVRIA
jgi:hypothetical protein